MYTMLSWVAEMHLCGADISNKEPQGCMCHSTLIAGVISQGSSNGC